MTSEGGHFNGARIDCSGLGYAVARMGLIAEKSRALMVIQPLILPRFVNKFFWGRIFHSTNEIPDCALSAMVFF
jgi:hypothetical protein